MSKRRDVHTVPKDGHWENIVSGRSTGVHHRTQESAAEAGRTIAERNESEHLIHRPNGQIREKNSYGNDPENIPG